MISKKDEEKLYRKYSFWLKREHEEDFEQHVADLVELLERRKTLPTQLIKTIFSYFVNEDHLFTPQIEKTISEVITLYEERFKKQDAYLFTFNAVPQKSVPHPKGYFLEVVEPVRKWPDSKRDWKDFISTAVNDYLQLAVIDEDILTSKRETVLYFHYALRDYLRDGTKITLTPRKKAIICGCLTMWVTGLALSRSAAPHKKCSNEQIFQGVNSITSTANPKQSNRGKIMLAKLKQTKQKFSK